MATKAAALAESPATTGGWAATIAAAQQARAVAAEAERAEAHRQAIALRALVVAQAPAFLDRMFEAFDLAVLHVNRALGGGRVLAHGRHETGGFYVRNDRMGDTWACYPDFAREDDPRPGVRVIDRGGRGSLLHYRFAADGGTLALIMQDHEPVGPEAAVRLLLGQWLASTVLVS
jgi:hypothetical protein